ALSTIRRSHWLFSTTAELTIRGGGMPYSNLALDADRENGPAARSFPTGQARGLKAHADAHDCIMVRIKRSYRIQVCGTKMCPNGELPSDPQPDRHRPEPEATQKPVSQFIVAPRDGLLRSFGLWSVPEPEATRKPVSQVIVAPRAHASRRC